MFAPATRAWFESAFGAPTDIQQKAWPRIAAGGHVLLTAPTGSGKTLTAFLWAIDRLASGAWERGSVRVLYVSPLKALNHDIAVNLQAPLDGLGSDLRVGVRSGDTDAAERRRQLRNPPDILVTTPESLNLLLGSHGGRAILGGVRSVILDEIHAVADGKRGTYLMTAVERLTELSGEFQRIALSATVKPLERMARFVGGPARTVETVVSDVPKRLDLTVHALDERASPPWASLAAEFATIAETNRATLFFVNNRALAERLARHMNEDREAPLAYAHHGSLAPATRRLVEEKLRAGELRAIVATGSLELGIDVGTLDEVVLVQAPRTLHSAVQRVGRAGHRVGATSVGRLYPTFGRDFVDAAVMAPLVRAREVESLRVPRAPLDVLAQVLVAMVGIEDRDPESIYELLRRSDPYRDLSRAAFDRVVAMAAGRYADSRVRELRARLHVDPTTGRLRAAKGALPLVWQSGGVIPDRGYFALRVHGTSARVGELDEEFVWERKRGDVFTLGSRSWRVESIRRNDVEVTPAGAGAAAPPFWRADAIPRDFELCARIGAFLADPDVDALDWPEAARDRLAAFLDRQRAATGPVLPHRHHVVVEHPRRTSTGGEGRQVVVHAPWGARVLRPLAIAISAAWDGIRADANDDGVLLTLAGDLSARELFRRVTAETVEPLLRERLERTGFFAARFRENAQRALLLPRRGARERMPLWLSRKRAARLLESVRGYDDFPILAETWRSCLEDEFDLPRLRLLLEEIADGTTTVAEVRTEAPSPFADSLTWRSTNEFIYAIDEPAHERSNLSDEVLRDALREAALRPRLDPALAREFDAKLRGAVEGYAPEDDDGWRTHVEERLLVEPWTERLPAGLERLGDFVVSARQRPRLERARGGDAAALESCLEEQLRYRGPVTAAELAHGWGPEADVRGALAALAERGVVIADRLTADANETQYCDRENLERLLRLQRRAHRTGHGTRPLADLPGFLAARQGIGTARELPEALDPLLGYVAPAALWESAILPARLEDRGDLDRFLRETDLLWFGGGPERIGFSFPDELPLFLEPREEAPAPFPDARARYEFFDLPGAGRSAELSRRLWALAFEGAVTNDSFEAVRQGIAHRFAPVAARHSARGRARWRSSRPLAGAWRVLLVPPPADALDALERDKERARVLLRRYGVLFRALLKAELPLLGWGRLQRALRLLELSGEAIGGRFFEGVDGLQFAAPDAARVEPFRGRMTINAMDPASPCGLGLDLDLPPRVASNWLVYDEGRLALVVRRHGAELEWRAAPRPEHLTFFLDRTLAVESLDGAPPGVLRELGFYEERGRWIRESARPGSSNAPA